MIVRRCTTGHQEHFTLVSINDYHDVRHCMPFVYRLFPESVYSGKKTIPAKVKNNDRIIIMPRSVLVKLDIQMHP